MTQARAGGLTLIKKYGVPEGGLENKDKGQTGTQNRTKQGHERGQGHAPGRDTDAREAGRTQTRRRERDVTRSGRPDSLLINLNLNLKFENWE